MPNTFIQTCVEDESERIILIVRGLAAELLMQIAPNVYSQYAETVKGQPVLYLECTNVIYGTLKAALLFYNKLVTDLKN